ncbi:all-trans retinoic acid-induced differentiation factor-like [Symsagittifera roscoffensis]|uniref:all-trans retinoic acid-induced differentiation factor-like n=1 Tax=Symsagittifera roscoffensis TaxID=84072 RepID=UPI00307BB822
MSITLPIVLTVLNIGLASSSQNTTCSIPEELELDCYPSVPEKSFTAFCEDHRGVVEGRCCFYGEASGPDILIGLNLRQCGIEDSQVIQQLGQEVLQQMQVLFMQANPFVDAPADSFLAMTQLDVLLLPSGCNCPGEAGVTWDNVSESGNSVLCQGQIPTTGDCPDHSHSESCGPNLYECLCNQKYSSYKCLRVAKKFPWKTFGPILAVLTVLTATLLFWKKHGYDSMRHLKHNMDARFIN